MLLGIYQSLALLVTFLIFYLIDFFFMSRYDRQRKQVGSGRAWDFTLWMLLAGALTVLQPIFLPWLGLSTPSCWGLVIQIIGILTVVTALALHVWARLHLRRFYAERIEVLPDHRVVDTGPYAIIRHPVIVSFFSLVIGLLLIDPAVTTVLMAIYVCWDFGCAARKEEDLLSKHLPNYKDYMQRTPRFLPRWRRNR